MGTMLGTLFLSPSVADGLIGVVVIAIVRIQLLSTADSIPHLWMAPNDKGKMSVDYRTTLPNLSNCGQ